MNPWSVDWTDYGGNHHTDPIDINCHCFDPTKTVVLNPNAWENIPNGQFGGAAEHACASSAGIRQPEENVNFSRNFRFKERVTLNVRVEFNNIFNRTRLPKPHHQPGTSPAAPTQFTTGANAGLYSGGFGTMNVAVRNERSAHRHLRRSHHVLTLLFRVSISPGRKPGVFLWCGEPSGDPSTIDLAVI